MVTIIDFLLIKVRMTILLETGSKPRISYYYEPNLSAFYYGAGHPMKPHRVAATHSLVVNYGLYDGMTVLRPLPAPLAQLQRFHSEDYIKALLFADSTQPLPHVPRPPTNELPVLLQKFAVGSSNDCPTFPGLFELASLAAGASVSAAAQLCTGRTDLAVNWLGGFHHAKKREAAGFCYVNDCVLAVLELLRRFRRVLYVDIDVHHGDGVEEAFFATDRVFTLSFHKFGDFYPGTGSLADVGTGEGRYFAMNLPLRKGLSDASFVGRGLFSTVLEKVVGAFRPEAVVLQSGADSLAGDRIGVFNLSTRGHAEAARVVKTLGLPTLVLGGGGYTTKNVARCWAYETSVICDVDVGEHLPEHSLLHSYAPDYVLHFPVDSELEDENSPEFLQELVQTASENLRGLEHSTVLFDK